MKVDGGGGGGGVDVRMKVQEEGVEGEEMAAKQYPPTQTRPKPFTKDEIFCTKPFTGCGFMQFIYSTHQNPPIITNKYNYFLQNGLFTKHINVQPTQASERMSQRLNYGDKSRHICVCVPP